MLAYLNDAAVNAVVRVPQSPVVPPLPDGALCRLGAALLQHHIHSEDALSGQAGHQLTAGTRVVRVLDLFILVHLMFYFNEQLHPSFLATPVSLILNIEIKQKVNMKRYHMREVSS